MVSWIEKNELRKTNQLKNKEGKSPIETPKSDSPAVGNDEIETKQKLVVEEMFEDPEKTVQIITEESPVASMSMTQNGKSRQSVPLGKDRERGELNKNRELWKNTKKETKSLLNGFHKKLDGSKEEQDKKSGFVDPSKLARPVSTKLERFKMKSITSSISNIIKSEKEIRLRLKKNSIPGSLMEDNLTFKKAARKTETNPINKITSQSVKFPVFEREPKRSCEKESIDPIKREKSETYSKTKMENATSWTNLKQKVLTGTAFNFPKLFDNKMSKSSSIEAIFTHHSKNKDKSKKSSN